MAAPLPDWPFYAFAYQPLNEGLQQNLPDGTLRSDFSQGLARQRQLFRNPPTTFVGQWAMTGAQFRLFKAFVAAMAGGRFNVPVFSDLEYVTVAANFVKGSITAKREGGEWIVSAQIETTDKLNISEAELVTELLVTDAGGLAIDDVLGAFHTAVQAGLV